MDKYLNQIYDIGHKRRIRTIIEGLDINPEDKILDCGCKDGFYTFLIHKLFGSPTQAIDITDDFYKTTNNIIKDPNVIFSIGDVLNLQYDNESFNKIIFTEVLEHVPDENKALSELRRTLKNGGLMAITVPNDKYPFNWDTFNWLREKLGLGHFDKDNELLAGTWWDHLRLYSHQEFKEKLEQNGFEILEMKSLTHYCMPMTYNLVTFMRYFYYHGNMSKNMTQEFDKFENNGRKSLFLDTFAKVNDFIDSFNDRIEDKEVSSATIFALVKKR